MKKLILSLMSFAVAACAFAAIVTPANPTNVSWYDYGREDGYNRLSFTLPTVDVNGNALNNENLGYRIYIDNDQIFTFERSVYSNDALYTDATSIYYYTWSGGSDIQRSCVYFYRTNAEGYERFFTWRIGIQAFFTNSDGTGESEIVYDEVFPQTTLPKPARPSITEWIDYEPITWPGGYLASCMMGYDIPNGIMDEIVADDGTTVLEIDKVSFSLFTDNDKIFTFTPEMFDQVDEPLTQFPCDLVTASGSVGYWMIDFDGLTNRVEILAENGIEAERFFDWRIGIQSYYTDGDQTSASDMYYMEIYPQLQEAKEVTSTSFFADWSCNAENTYLINNFIGNNCGYFLYVINKETQDTVLVENVAPTNPIVDENNHAIPDPIPGATYTVEGLSPGTTYQYYVVVVQNTGMTYQSVVREVTLPTEDVTHYTPGDVNHDQVVDVNDVTMVISHILGTEVEICPICANVNGDDAIDVADVTTIISIILSAE